MPQRALLTLGIAVVALAACDADPPDPDGGPAGTDAGARMDGAPAPDGARPDGGADRDGGAPSPFSRCPSVSADPTTGAELPRERVDTTFPTQGGATIRVEAGEDLQAAIDGAAAGDTLVLAAGAEFTGPFTLRDHAGGGWVVITSDGALPPEGQRVSPDDAPAMARLLAPAGLSAITTAPGAHHYRLVGLEITTATDALSYNLVDLGSGQSDPAEKAHHVVLDRCYLHGAPTAGTRRGVAMNGRHLAVIESYLTDFRETSADSQAIAGWSGPGPFGVYGSYLAGAAENIMFGGARSNGPGTNPADIEICGNHFDKPLSWYALHPSYAGLDWSIKNLFELKNARRVLLAGNVLEHSWGDSQVGFAILLTPRAEGDTSLEHAVTDVTIAYNEIRHVAAGLNLAGLDDGTPGSLPSERIAVFDNLFHDVDGPGWNGAGRSFQVIFGGGTGHDLLIAHNTALLTGNAAMAMGDSAPVYDGVVIRDNLLARGEYGVFGSGQGEGAGALDFYMPGATFTGNVVYGDADAAPRYPSGNFFPASADDVGFADLAGGDYALGASSPYATASTDGRAVGADVARVRAATAGVVR